MIKVQALDEESPCEDDERRRLGALPGPWGRTLRGGGGGGGEACTLNPKP